MNHVERDLARLNAELHRLGAVITLDDGSVVIDPAKAPADLVRVYGEVVSYGFASGLIGGEAA